MTPKEKAKELVDKFYQLFPLQKDVISIYGTLSWEYDNWKQAKQCALMAVDEVIDQYYLHTDNVNQHTYWQEVKDEIDLL
jgi:hypothetical protein